MPEVNRDEVMCVCVCHVLYLFVGWCVWWGARDFGFVLFSLCLLIEGKGELGARGGYYHRLSLRSLCLTFVLRSDQFWGPLALMTFYVF